MIAQILTDKCCRAENPSVGWADIKGQLNRVWKNTFKLENIQLAWKKAGLVPFTRVPLLKEVLDRNGRKKAHTRQSQPTDFSPHTLSSLVASKTMVLTESELEQEKLYKH